MAQQIPRVPPPPIPDLDWSTPAAYLSSCHAWLDQMQVWQTATLPAWIEHSRKYLLERTLLDPSTQVALPDVHRATAAIPVQPFATIAEMRLPSID